MEHDANAPPEARTLLAGMLRDYDSALGRLKDEDGP